MYTDIAFAKRKRVSQRSAEQQQQEHASMLSAYLVSPQTPSQKDQRRFYDHPCRRPTKFPVALVSISQLTQRSVYAVLTRILDFPSDRSFVVHLKAG